MGDYLNSTNVIIGIVAGLVTIFGPIVGVLNKRQTALKTIESQPPNVQIEIRERWSVLGLIWRTWMGILLGIVFAVMFTVVPDFVINGFIAGINNMQTHGFSGPDLSNPVVFAICAILGVSVGISVALGVAAPKRFAQYTGQTHRSMSDPNNPFGWTHPSSPNNPNNPGNPFYHRN
jgi:hypothetical protein